MTSRQTVPDNCTDCAFHKVLPDPDPHDWFCDDDSKVVCSKSVNVEGVPKSITVACRPYNIKRESVRPTWCPLLENTNG